MHNGQSVSWVRRCCPPQALGDHLVFLTPSEVLPLQLQRPGSTLPPTHPPPTALPQRLPSSCFRLRPPSSTPDPRPLVSCSSVSVTFLSPALALLSPLPMTPGHSFPQWPTVASGQGHPRRAQHGVDWGRGTFGADHIPRKPGTCPALASSTALPCGTQKPGAPGAERPGVLPLVTHVTHPAARALRDMGHTRRMSPRETEPAGEMGGASVDSRAAGNLEWAAGGSGPGKEREGAGVGAQPLALPCCRVRKQGLPVAGTKSDSMGNRDHRKGSPHAAFPQEEAWPAHPEGLPEGSGPTPRGWSKTHTALASSRRLAPQASSLGLPFWARGGVTTAGPPLGSSSTNHTPEPRLASWPPEAYGGGGDRTSQLHIGHLSSPLSSPLLPQTLTSRCNQKILSALRGQRQRNAYKPGTGAQRQAQGAVEGPGPPLLTPCQPSWVEGEWRTNCDL